MNANAYINGLTYDPRDIMVDNSAVPEYKKEDGKLEADGTFLVIKKKQCTVEDNSSELTYIDSLAARLFPGTMLLCNSKLIENAPSIVNLDTKPVKFNIDLPGFDGSIHVDKLSKSNLEAAVNAKIKEWKAANPKGNIAAKIKQSVYEVKNQHKLEVDLGFKLSSAKQTFNVDFNAIEKGESREWILKFEQIYYNVALDAFNNPGDIIADSVTADTLKQCGVNDKNPIGIVNNVSYGRIIYIRFRTNKTELDISSKMNIILSDTTTLDAKAKVEWQQIKDQVSTDVFVYGGGTSAFNKVPNINMDTIHQFIEQGYNFDANQESAPIGYSVVFMKNGGQDLATINSTSTYIETTVERFNAATLEIEQNGAFVNVFHINWNEISYNNGVAVVTPCSWERNGKDSCVKQRYKLFFRGNVRNLHIKSRGKTGIVWDKFRTNYDADVPLMPKMTLKVSGTTLRQKAELSYPA